MSKVVVRGWEGLLLPPLSEILPHPKEKNEKKIEKFTPSRFKTAMFNEVLPPPQKKRSIKRRLKNK
jgi:hypothetical protein